MSQTAYNQSLAVGRAGMLADGGNRHVISKNNQSGGALNFGLAVVQGSADNECTLPASAADVTGQGKLLGVALIDLSVENKYPEDSSAAAYVAGAMVNVLNKGRAWVTVEEAVTPTSPVYVRFATDGGTNTQPGSFRASSGATGSAVAQVDTLTPTAVNSTQYFVEIKNAAGDLVTYEFTSDGSATATKIVTGFTALMANDPTVTVSGTTTLILTAKTAGTAFTTFADSNMAIVHTTANASTTATAAQVTNARYLTTQATVGGLAVVEFNNP